MRANAALDTCAPYGTVVGATPVNPALQTYRANGLRKTSPLPVSSQTTARRSCTS